MKKWFSILLVGLLLFDGFMAPNLRASAATATGWKQVSGHWYYYTSKGKVTGWLLNGGKWYYLDSKGVMKTGWLSLNGKWYYLDSKGVMKTGWLSLSGKWYFLNSSGVMVTGWSQISQKWYYFYSSGVMALNTTIQGYKLGNDGARIADTIKPVFSGIKDTEIHLGDVFDPLDGVTASDNIDGNVTSKIQVSGSVDADKVGVYTLTYTVKDNAGNTASTTRVITVIDATKPVFSGIRDTQIHIGDVFDPLDGVSATDNNDGNLTSKIQVKGSVDASKAGVYTLTYTVTDNAGNTATATRTITVIDSIPPVLSGVQDTQINFGASFNPLDGISASDNNDGDITSKIQVSGSVDVNKAGTYTLTYSVTDQSGNTSTASRKVTVIDNVSPVLSGVDNKTIGLYTSFNALDGVTATDNNDGDLTSKIQVSGSVDTQTEGQYRVTYTVYDAAGNMTQVERIITVQKIDVTNVSISGPDTIKTGQTSKLAAVISPSNATNQQVTWQSSDNSIASIDENGTLTTLTEGTVTITATVDGVSASKTITVSDRPNLFLYKSGSAVINNVYSSLSISIVNYEPQESVSIKKVEVYENNSIYSSYTDQSLQSSGISTTIAPSSSWGMTINYKVGPWQNQSKVVVTVQASNGNSYQYSINI